MRYNGGGGPRAALVNKEEPPVPTDMKKNIAEAVLTLLMERHVKKLTVKDIVEQCHITRQAFYQISSRQGNEDSKSLQCLDFLNSQGYSHSPS